METTFTLNETVSSLILENDVSHNDHYQSAKFIPMVLVSIISSLTITAQHVNFNSRDSIISNLATTLSNYETNESFFNDSMINTSELIERSENMSIDDKDFGALQQQVKSHDQIIVEIRNSLNTLNTGISDIKIQTAKTLSKDDINELIIAAINKARLNTIAWIWGAAFTVLTGIGVITTIAVNILKK